MSLTDRVRNEEVLHIVKEERKVLQTVQKGKVNWIGHILPSRHSFSWFPCVCLQANAEMVPKTASCYCMLLL